MAPRRLVSIAHSYCVGLNRRLAHELARAGAGRWEVTAVAPSSFAGELGQIDLRPEPGEPCRLEAVPAYLSRRIHLMFYGWRLREILSRNWDMIHCWEEPYVTAGAQVALLAPARIPFVFWTAQNLSKTYPPPFRWFEGYCVHRASGWLACGQSTVNAMVSRGYGAKPHRVAPLGVDLEVFSPEPRQDAAGPPVVGYLGRFIHDKGVRLLMRALDGVPSSWRALFVGGGPLERELRAWASRYGDRVRIVTGVPHNEVPLWLRRMDLLCAPSQTMPSWREQQGRMIVEAFACGLPVLASDSGEIPFVVGDAGLVLPEASVESWTRAIDQLIQDPSARREWGNRGLDRARGKFAWPAIARDQLSFFESLLDAPSR